MSESEIVGYAFTQIKSDKWAKTHCIGFTADINKINALKKILSVSKIEFVEDKIPYYGADRTVYRVFVLGCDIKETEYLKNNIVKKFKYLKEHRLASCGVTCKLGDL